MRLRRFDAVAPFRDRVEGFLAARECVHALPLGILSDLAGRPAPDGLYLAAVEDAGEVVAVALRTPPFGLVVSCTAVPAALELVAADVPGPLPAVNGVSEEARAFARAWVARGDQAERGGMGMRSFEATTVTRPATTGALRRAVAADRALVLGWWRAFTAEALGPDEPDHAESSVDALLAAPAGGLFLWVDGEPVALAVAKGLTPTGIRLGPVYTPPDRRRRGYGSAVTAGVTQRMLDEGRSRCFLFTDLANPTSNHIYTQIGYRPCADHEMIRFTASRCA